MKPTALILLSLVATLAATGCEGSATSVSMPTAQIEAILATSTPRPTPTTLGVATISPTPPATFALPTETSDLFDAARIRAAIAFVDVGNEDQYSTLWAISGRQAVRLLAWPSTSGLVSSQIAISPDFSHIAFTQLSGANGAVIATVNIASSQVTPLLEVKLTVPGLLWEPGGLSSSSWSPNSRWLQVGLISSVAANDTGEYVDAILDPNQPGDMWRLAPDESFVAWLPDDGDKFAILRGKGRVRDLVVLSAADRAYERIAIADILHFTLSQDAPYPGVFSPDGTKLALVVSDVGYDIILCDLEAVKCRMLQTDFDAPFLSGWSPNADWLTLWDRAVYALPVLNPTERWTAPYSETDTSVAILGWVDPRTLLYQSGTQIWQAMPAIDNSEQMILDLRDTGVEFQGKPGQIELASPTE